MPPVAIDQRDKYQSDEQIPIAYQPLLWLGAMSAAILVGYGLHLVFLIGLYKLLLVPGLAGIALLVVMSKLVLVTHCRNSRLARVVAGLCGVTAYLSYFYFCLWHESPDAAPNILALPHYIESRNQNQLLTHNGKPVNALQPDRPLMELNWLFFFVDGAIITGLPVFAAWKVSREAYSVDLKQWMKSETTYLPTSSGEAFLHALENEQLTTFVALTTRSGEPRLACQLQLEYAIPQTGSAFEFPVYATVEDFSPTELSQKRPRRKTLASQFALTPTEVRQLCPWFPKLAAHLDVHLPESERPALHSPNLPLPELTGETAEISPIPEPFRQRLRTRGYRLKAFVINLVPTVLMFSGVIVFAIGAILLAIHETLPYVIPIIGGIAVAAWGFYVGGSCLGVYENRWLERRLRNEIATRADSLVNATCLAHRFVELIPRESFDDPKYSKLNDMLLLQIDYEQRLVLLEGDLDRFRIPANSIVACEPQCFVHPTDLERENQLWLLRLLTQVPTGLREILLSLPHTSFHRSTNAGRLRATQEKCEQINQLR